MMRVLQRSDGERGVALLVVLLMLVVLSTVAMAAIDDVKFAVRRTVNMRLGDQAQWYAYGAEDMARQVIWRGWKADPARSTLESAWARQGVRFEIDGGLIDGDIADAGNCFNLNSVVEELPGGKLVATPLGGAQMQNLLVALDINADDAAVLAAALTDWIDSDQSPVPRGAEDYDYALLDPPYRTAGTLMTEPEELRALRGMDEEIYRRIRPFVCALPQAIPSPVNVNTLRPHQAPLLVMLTGSKLSLTEAARVIENRPSAGFNTVEAFWASDGFQGLNPGEDVQRQVRLNTRFYTLTARVTYHEAYFALNSTLVMNDAGHVHVASRRFGDVE